MVALEDLEFDDYMDNPYYSYGLDESLSLLELAHSQHGSEGL